MIEPEEINLLPEEEVNASLPIHPRAGGGGSPRRSDRHAWTRSRLASAFLAAMLLVYAAKQATTLRARPTPTAASSSGTADAEGSIEKAPGEVYDTAEEEAAIDELATSYNMAARTADIIADLPSGWTQVPSKSRPGQASICKSARDRFPCVCH